MKHVIVGSGVAGVTAAQSIVRADADAQVHLLGEESFPYYRRPMLWEFISGQVTEEEVYFRPLDWYAEQGIHIHLSTQVTALDPEAHCLTLSDGAAVQYDRLLLATGARSFIPPCQGTDKVGVFTLRTLEDARAIKAYAQNVATAVVIGGGLLGLETARALHTAGLDVTVVEFYDYLLPRQLDAEGAQVLESLLEGQGLHIVTGGVTEAILGEERVAGIQLQDERTIPGELVLFSTGIQSETTVAQAAGIHVNRGIVVDEELRTSAEDVWAAGDVAEFEGRVYGIIPPAIEQARIAAANMVTPGSAAYAGTIPSTTLKVAGAELMSLGECTVENSQVVPLRRVDAKGGRYRKLALRDGCIVGAILLNDQERTQAIQQLIERKIDVSANADHLLDDAFDLKSLFQRG
ncbi:MAG TPA: NAD(P)/FAD-dependent oxidoreductase [Chloroflexi bacterium]|nr:NAD(P)/FAD-dependent oxidoreductase [Chloroflexota bacterium]